MLHAGRSQDRPDQSSGRGLATTSRDAHDTARAQVEEESGHALNPVTCAHRRLVLKILLWYAWTHEDEIRVAHELMQPIRAVPCRVVDSKGKVDRKRV
jgi:hypothetical protein